MSENSLPTKEIFDVLERIYLRGKDDEVEGASNIAMLPAEVLEIVSLILKPVKAEWAVAREFGDDNKWQCVPAPNITLRCIPVSDGKWTFRTLGLIEHWNEQTYDSLEEAQSAAIAWYNFNAAELQKLEA